MGGALGSAATFTLIRSEPRAVKRGPVRTLTKRGEPGWLARHRTVPPLVRSQTGYWELRRLQDHILIRTSMSAEPLRPARGNRWRSDRYHRGALGRAHAPGTEAGRRVDGRAAAGLRSAPVQGFAFGRAIDLVLEWRLEGGKWAVSSISQKEVASAWGATIGAVVGAVIAVAAMQIARGSNPSVGRRPSHGS